MRENICEKGLEKQRQFRNEMRTWIGDIVSFRKNVNEATRSCDEMTLFWDNNACRKFSFFSSGLHNLEIVDDELCAALCRSLDQLGNLQAA